MLTLQKKNFSKILAAAVLMGLFVASAAFGQTERAFDPAAFEKAVETELQETKTPGAAVAIVSGDRIVFAKGFGETSIEGGSRVTADTLFRMGSTTKMFTAAAAVALADAGKIKLNVPVGEYVKGLPPKLAGLTMHQLLSQSSGLRDFGPLASGHDDDVLGRNVRLWKEDVFFTDPDKIYSYSSANYWLAGLAVESIMGRPYADSLADLILNPLGMKRSAVRPFDAMTFPLALGHNVASGNVAVVRPIDNNAAKYPGGSLYSNVNELSRFAIAMMNDGRIEGSKAIAESVVAEIQKPQFQLPGGDAFYGYGLLGYDVQGVKTVSHGGVSRGYGSTIFFAPEHKFAVIVLTNSNGQTLPKARNLAMRSFLPLKPEATPAAQAASDAKIDNARYVGTYRHEPGTWTVFDKGGKLFLKQSSGEFELKNTGKDRFSYEEGEIMFVPNGKGEIEHIFMGLYAARRVGR